MNKTQNPQFWLMKSEPEVYSIDDLKRDHTTQWEGVRNYQARNFMMKDMKIGDRVFFYHSNAKPPGIAGIAEISGLAEPDPSANTDKPIWFCVRIRFVEKLKRFVSLTELKTIKGLEKMPLLQKGSRLSVQPVGATEFKKILEISKS